MDAAGSFKRPRRLMREYDVKPKRTELVKMVDNLVSKVRHIHRHLGDASCFKGEQVMFDQRFAPKRNQRFWRGIGQGGKALAAPGGQNHC